MSQCCFNVPLVVHLCHVCVVCIDVSQVVQNRDKHASMLSVKCSSFWHSDSFTLAVFEMFSSLIVLSCNQINNSLCYCTNCAD